MRLLGRTMLVLTGVVAAMVCGGEGARNPPVGKAGKAKFMPPEGKRLIMVGQDNSNVYGYMQSMGHVPGAVTGYIPLESLLSMTGPTDWGTGNMDLSAYARDRNLDNTAFHIGLWYPNIDEGVPTGQWDWRIRELATWCKNQPRVIYLRIGFEFDHIPGGGGHYYQISTYVAGYKRIVDIFDEIGVANVDFVWQSEGVHSIDTMMQYYPGDEYVDWMAYSIFTIGKPADRPLTWRGSELVKLAEQRGKPVLISESSTYGLRMEHSNGAQVWREYHQVLLDFMADHPIIKGWHYINADWDAQQQWAGGGWGNSRMQDNAEVKRRWLAEVTNGEKWVSGAPGTWGQLGYPASSEPTPPPSPTPEPPFTPPPPPTPEPPSAPACGPCNANGYPFWCPNGNCYADNTCLGHCSDCRGPNEPCHN